MRSFYRAFPAATPAEENFVISTSDDPSQHPCLRPTHSWPDRSDFSLLAPKHLTTAFTPLLSSAQTHARPLGMQSYRLRRRLRSHYSLLIPFPPLPFAFPPLSPASPVAEPLQSPALPSRGSRSTSSQTVRPGEHPFPPAPFLLREDGGAEDAPLEPDLEGDRPTPGLEPRSSKSTSVAGRAAVRPVAFGPEEAFLVDFSRTYDPLNPQVRLPSPASPKKAPRN